jgi:hypothetical protein
MGRDLARKVGRKTAGLGNGLEQGDEDYVKGARGSSLLDPGVTLLCNSNRPGPTHHDVGRQEEPGYHSRDDHG